MIDVESRVMSISGGPLFGRDPHKARPHVFIALGGSGKDVVMRLRKRFFDRFHTKDPGHARFVFIDTDTQKFGSEGGEFGVVRRTPAQSKRAGCRPDHRGSIRIASSPTCAPRSTATTSRG